MPTPSWRADPMKTWGVALTSAVLLTALGTGYASAAGDEAPAGPAIGPALVSPPVFTGKPTLIVDKVVPGKFRKRNPNVPSTGKVYFHVEVQANTVAHVGCNGITWENVYQRRYVRSGRTYRLSMMAGDPRQWAVPAVYYCRVSAIPKDCGTCGTISEEVRIEVPAVRR